MSGPSDASVFDDDCSDFASATITPLCNCCGDVEKIVIPRGPTQLDPFP